MLLHDRGHQTLRVPLEARGDVRVEGDVRGTAAGVVLAYNSPVNQIVAWLDSATRRLVLDVTVAGVVTTTTAALPANFNYNSWHTIALERRGRQLTAEVSADRLRDATGSVSVTVSSRSSASDMAT